MTKEELEELNQLQPHPARRSDERNFWQKNWQGTIMIGAFLVGQLWNGGAWFGGTNASTQELQQRVASLQKQLDDTRTVYVRQDVFAAVLESINQRLASIDRKVSERR